MGYSRRLLGRLERLLVGRRGLIRRCPTPILGKKLDFRRWENVTGSQQANSNAARNPY
jgi:hypothetical protein